MSIPDLESVKRHLRLTTITEADERWLLDMLTICIREVEDLTGVKSTDSDLNPAFNLCILLLIAHRWENREIVTERVVNRVPYSFDYLILNLRKEGDF